MKNLQPTLSCDLSRHDLASVLQLLEGQRATGTLRAGGAWLRLRCGRVVKASGDFGTPEERALATVEVLIDTHGTLEFRGVLGEPSGEVDIAPTALLLEAARLRDELTSKGGVS